MPHVDVRRIWRLFKLCFPLLAGAWSAGCASRSVSEDARGQNPSEIVYLSIDWDYQLRYPDSATVPEEKLRRVRAKVVQLTYPAFDSPSVGGPGDRTAVLELLDGEKIPMHGKAKRVLLQTTTAGQTSRFLERGTVCTLVFTTNGLLYDVLNARGQSAGE